jgi:hypothetical protein
VIRALLLALAFLPGILPGQSITVYSEFYRVDPFGNVVPADDGAPPREILSPAAGRNGYSSYRIVVNAPPSTPFTLHIAQNPENTAQVELYREVYAKVGDNWIPDQLEKVDIPYTGTITRPDRPIPGQTVQSFWLDFRVPPSAPPVRFRLEAQLNVGDGWIIYPLEVRVQQTSYPTVSDVKSGLAPIDAPADATAAGVLRDYLCASPVNKPEAGTTVRQLIRRNALQDAALARSLETPGNKQVTQQAILWSTGLRDQSPPVWCKAPKRPEGVNSEWYLKVRGYLLSGKR